MLALEELNCYLCDSNELFPSDNFKKIAYLNLLYRFAKCDFCKSYSLFPKLDNEKIERMYSKEYSQISTDSPIGHDQEYLTKFLQLRKFLFSESKSSMKTFLDYGCGYNPVTLQFAREMGYIAQGVEFSEDVVGEANEKNLGPVMGVKKFNSMKTNFDYVFMGDVIEHFVNPIHELKRIHERVAQDGYLVAQGPLQGAFTVSHLLVNLKAQISRNKFSNFPPYHVSLATRKGMIALMSSTGFEIVNFKVGEKHWPAPTLKSAFKNFSLREFTIFAIKIVDRLISHVSRDYGSHYFLVAKKKEKIYSCNNLH